MVAVKSAWAPRTIRIDQKDYVRIYPQCSTPRRIDLLFPRASGMVEVDEIVADFLIGKYEGLTKETPPKPEEPPAPEETLNDADESPVIPDEEIVKEEAVDIPAITNKDFDPDDYVSKDEAKNEAREAVPLPPMEKRKRNSKKQAPEGMEEQ